MINKEKTIQKLEEYYIDGEGKNDILFDILKDSIDNYNRACEDIKQNGIIVESYKQKYLSPSFKAKNQSIKEITKVIKMLLDNQNNEEKDLLADIMMLDK